MALEFGAEVLHSNQFCFGALPVNIPRIVTAHSDVLSWARACRGSALEDSPWLSRYLELARHGLAEASAVVTPTQWMANSLAGDFALPGPPLVIPNGRSIPEVPGGPRKMQAVTAGRLWDEAKNVSILTKVDSPVPLLLAGDVQNGPAQIPEKLHGVTLLGSLASEELLRLFRESAMYICTSRYEPFGLAPLESALCGCAVLAHDIPSLREVGQGGAVYFRDEASLTDLLHRLCKRPGELAAAQSRSLQRARTFTSERMAAAYEKLFRHWIARSEEARICPAVSV
jgi:glycosyltransferase involved in cell wall biosynthesis